VDGLPAARNRVIDAPPRVRPLPGSNRDELHIDLQMVTTVSRRDARKYTFASFVVEDGRPGAHQL
jgi:hypothetical protein